MKPTANTGFALFAKRFVSVLSLIAAVSAAPRPAEADEASIAFIRALGNQAVSVIRSDMPVASKAAYFDRMIHEDFDLTGICRLCSAPIGVSRPRRNGTSSAICSRIGSFASTAGSSRNPATGISS
jgi:hypothetical protein